MESQWFFSWGVHQFGPFSEKELKDLASLGRLQPSDIVWKTGMAAGSGVVAARVKNLFVVPPPQVISVSAPDPIPLVSSASMVVAQPAEIDQQPATGAVENTESAMDTASEEASPLGESSDEILDSDQTSANDSPAPQNGSSNRRTPGAEKKKQKTAKPVRGVVLLSQDGERVSFRKKCPKCGYEDSARHSLPIRNGMMRVTFFCPTCKKTQSAEIQGAGK